VGIMAMVAEEEGRMISARTKAALAAAKTSRCSARRLQQESEANSESTQSRPGSQRSQGSGTGS
jgi:hypothetical protein